MTAYESVIYGAFFDTHSGSVLTDYKFLDVLQTMLTFVVTFELEYGIPFIGPEDEDISAVLKSSNFLSGSSLETCK